jgi:hypothetical protein
MMNGECSDRERVAPTFSTHSTSSLRVAGMHARSGTDRKGV